MPHRHILVVEDDLDGQEMVATMLRHMNFTVDTVDDGEQAAYVLFHSHQTYSAVVIDLALPNKDGWQLLGEILDKPHLKHLPCVA